MSLELQHIIERVLLPPGSLILLGLLGLILFHKRLGKIFIFISLLGVYLLSTPIISEQLMKGLETYPALSVEDAKKSGAQAIVVLGGGLYLNATEYSGDTVSSLNLERLRYAAWLSRHTGLPIIPSGGVVTKGTPEAVLAQKTLSEEFGVKVAAIEDASRTTRENAQLTKVVLDQLGFSQILLVTHACHMPRAMYVMKKAGIKALAAPTSFQHRDGKEGEIQDWLPDTTAMQHSSYAVHEYVGKFWYQITPI